jgi:hypothetical protein
MIRIKIFSLVACLAALSSCSKSFLDLHPNTNLTSDNFYTTEDDYKQAVVGIYGPLQTLFNDAYVMGEMRSDNTKYFFNTSIGGGGYQEKYDIAMFNDLPSPNNSVIANKWVSCYSGIARANSVLQRIDNAAISDSVKKNVKGQAEFLRAYYYFELVQYFGRVPLHLKEVTSIGETALPQSSVEDVYKQIIADATDAAGLLPVTQAIAGQVTKGSAETLLGYVYMTRKNYPLAEQSLTTVTQLNYQLLPDYASLFQPNNKNNAESIFEVQYMEGTMGLGNNFAYQFGPQTTNSINYTGVSGNTTLIGGWNKPTDNLLAAYEAGDKRKGASIANGYTDGDGNFVTYTFVKKYTHPPYAQFNICGDDWLVYRYADVLLLLAEALNEQGKSPDAIPYVNKVRARAGLAPLTVSSQDDVRIAIAHERRIELAFENHRWLDLVRTDQATPVMTAFGAGLSIPGDVNNKFHYEPYKQLFPIPQDEINLNPLLVQNTGYPL